MAVDFAGIDSSTFILRDFLFGDAFFLEVISAKGTKVQVLVFCRQLSPVWETPDVYAYVTHADI